MQTLPQRRHFIVDRAALDHCQLSYHRSFREMFELCVRSGLQLFVIDQDRLIPISSEESFELWNGVFTNNSVDHSDVSYEIKHVGNVVTLRANESCECRAGACVRDAVLSTIDSDDSLIVFLKDETKLCLATLADRIFVIGDLQRLCALNHLPHHPVRQWFDCQRILSTQSKHSKDQRRQARLLRMEASKTE